MIINKLIKRYKYYVTLGKLKREIDELRIRNIRSAKRYDELPRGLDFSDLVEDAILCVENGGSGVRALTELEVFQLVKKGEERLAAYYEKMEEDNWVTKIIGVKGNE